MHTCLCVRENVPAETLAAVAGPVSCVRVGGSCGESIVFLFYLLGSYISTSRGKGHTETGAKGQRAMKYSQGTQSQTVPEVVYKTIGFKLEDETTDGGKELFAIY